MIRSAFARYSALFALALLAMLLPVTVLAQGAATSTPPAAGLSFQEVATLVVSTIVGIGVIGYRIIVALGTATQVAQSKEAREAFLQAVKVAYWATANVAKVTDTKLDDKAAYALGLLKDALEAEGKTLSEEDAKRAKVLFDALHGEEVKVVPVTPEQLLNLPLPGKA